MPKPLRVFLVATLSLTVAAQIAFADETKKADAPANGAVKFAEQVEPIFRAHCQGCHQPARPEGGLVMTDAAALARGGDSGAVIVAGNPGESHLLAEITPVDGKAEMPKGKPPLSQAEIDIIRKWIAEGASTEGWKSNLTSFDSSHPPSYAASPVVTAVSYSPDGKWLAVSGYNEVLLLQAGSHTIAKRLIGRSERIEDLRFSPDSQSLAVSGGVPGVLGELQIWNVADGTLKHSIVIGGDTIYGANWSPDGSLVSVGCSDRSIRAFRAADGEQVVFSATHEDWALDTTFDVKGEHLVSVSRDRSMKLVHIPTQRFVDNITSITPGAQKGGLIAVDRHPTRDEVVCGGADSIPKIYRIFREKERRIGDDFNLIRALPTMKGRIYDVQFSADGQFVVAGSSDRTGGQIAIYKTDDGQQLSMIEMPSGVFAVGFSADAKQIAGGGAEGKLILIDRESGKITQSIDLAKLVSDFQAQSSTTQK